MDGLTTEELNANQEDAPSKVKGIEQGSVAAVEGTKKNNAVFAVNGEKGGIGNNEKVREEDASVESTSDSAAREDDKETSEQQGKETNSLDSREKKGKISDGEQTKGKTSEDAVTNSFSNEDNKKEVQEVEGNLLSSEEIKEKTNEEQEVQTSLRNNEDCSAKTSEEQEVEKNSVSNEAKREKTSEEDALATNLLDNEESHEKTNEQCVKETNLRNIEEKKEKTNEDQIGTIDSLSTEENHGKTNEQVVKSNLNNDRETVSEEQLEKAHSRSGKENKEKTTEGQIEKTKTLNTEENNGKTCEAQEAETNSLNNEGNTEKTNEQRVEKPESFNTEESKEKTGDTQEVNTISIEESREKVPEQEKNSSNNKESNEETNKQRELVTSSENTEEKTNGKEAETNSVMYKANEVDSGSERNNGETQIASKQSSKEAARESIDLVDLLQSSRTEKEDGDPLDKCEVSESGDDHNYTQKKSIISDLLKRGPSLLRETLVTIPKRKKQRTAREPDAVHTISDSDSDSVVSVEIKGTNLQRIRNDILALLEKQEPKVFTEEEKAIKRSSYNNDQQRVQFTRIHCTACNKHLGSALNKQKDRYIHPLFKVLVCKRCYNFYMSGDFEKDEDGSELYCRWCGQGGKVICCSKCEYVFCSMCIKRNYGAKRLQFIKNSEDWLCFSCDRSQLLQIQIHCATLFAYLRNEMQRLSGTNDVNLYKTDYTNCCVNRKRKLSWSKDGEFDISEELSRAKKPKTTKTKAVSTAKILNSQEEEEVVCAPDLLSFMDEDDQIDGVVVEKPTQPTPPAPPPLVPTPTFRLVTPVVLPKNAVFVQNPVRNTLVVQNQPSPALVHNPASMVQVKGKQIVLNTTLNNPITPQNIGNLTSSVEKVSTHKITLKTPNQALPKLVPGLKYEWFEQATKNTVDIQTKLSFNISTLNAQKDTATTMDDLAKIHNKFQEVLSKSINSMIQIRRTLRNDFLSSLNQLKFIKKAEELRPEDDDDDVVFVDATVPQKPPEPVQSTSVAAERPHGPYLKVRSVSQLFNVPSECITIPDDVIEKITESKKEEDARRREAAATNDSNKENINNDSNKINTVASKEDSEPKNETVEITPEIQKAMFESKIEKLISDNYKYKIKGISVKEFKRMLSARVYVSKNYKPKKKRSAGQDFEALLDSSVVLKK